MYEDAWEDYVWWQTQDRKAIKRINALIKDTQRSPYEGIGKPEPLKNNLSGWWSRRIEESNRLVYKVKDDLLIIAECKKIMKTDTIEREDLQEIAVLFILSEREDSDLNILRL